MGEPRPPTIHVHLSADSLRESLCSEALIGLTADPKELSPKWLYDEVGSGLFEEITELPEYYPTRTERGILENRADQIPALTGADTVVELGSGSSSKTRLLLDSFVRRRQLRRFVPFDVSEAALRASAHELASDYPDTQIHGLVGDFDLHLQEIPPSGRKLVVFLGGTIGNFPPTRREWFLKELSSSLQPGDSLLLGTDLVKEPARLHAAYDDSRGVTAAFNLNLLTILNRELGADFDLRRFEHVAVFDPVQEWVEMRLRSLADQVVSLPTIGLEVRFLDREEMRTEISAKFRRAGIEAELQGAGFELARWWTDARHDFALSLSFLAVG